MYWTVSWIVLLILLLVQTQSLQVGPVEIDSIIQGTPAFWGAISVEFILIMMWMTDIAWKNLKEVRREGLTTHFQQLWNILDFMMVAVYLAMVALRLVALFKLDAHSEQNTVADDWAYKAKESSFQPVAVADVLFSIFTIVVFIRAMSLFTDNRFLGMLLISIGRMAVSIMKFVVLDGLVLFAFALGLNQLYWFYGTMHQYLCSNYSQSNLQALSCSKSQGFDTIFSSLQSLFWAGFGIVDLSTLELKPGTSPVNVFQIQEWPVITETVGKLVFGLYEVIGVLVLINLLIAIMSDSFTRTEEVKRVDWGFVVMKDALRYLKVDVSLPPPFGLIMSVRNALVRPMLALCGRRNNPPDTDNNVETADGQPQAPLPGEHDAYKMIVGSLMTRYLLRKERSLE